MDKSIKTLVEQTPNDSELGRKIRQMYWAQNSANEVITNQITLDQMINEVKGS